MNRMEKYARAKYAENSEYVKSHPEMTIAELMCMVRMQDALYTVIYSRLERHLFGRGGV